MHFNESVEMMHFFIYIHIFELYSWIMKVKEQRCAASHY